MNQNCDAGHYKREVSIDCTRKVDRVLSGSRGVGRGKQFFISNEELKKVTSFCQLLNDDRVFFKVAVLSSDHQLISCGNSVVVWTTTATYS